MSRIQLFVERRTHKGKGPSRRLRAQGKVPAVFYGHKNEPVKLFVDAREFLKVVEEAGSNPLFDLVIRDNGETTTRRAMLKERQVRPVDVDVLHLDFQEVFMDEKIEVTVPIDFQGKPVGLDKGGAFQIVARELLISCLPDDIPGEIVVDVSGLDIGHSVHVGEIPLPAGVIALQDKGVALATVAAPKKEEEAPAEAEEPAAPAAPSKPEK